MKGKNAGALVWMQLALPLCLCAQRWAPELKPEQAAEWSIAGAGAIPARTVHCAALGPEAESIQINRALAACPADQTVYLEAGDYTVTEPLRIPSNVTLRGAGADKTVLHAAGKGEAIIAMSNGEDSFSTFFDRFKQSNEARKKALA